MFTADVILGLIVSFEQTQIFSLEQTELVNLLVFHRKSWKFMKDTIT